MHGPMIFGLLVRFVRDRAAAEDLWQETFFAASEALRRGERAESAGAWLRTVATRKAVDHARRLAARPAVATDGIDAAARMPAPEAAPRADFEDDLAALPPLERTATLLAYQEGLSMREIAELCAVPVGTVKTWLFRARGLLRARFERDGR